VFINIELTFVDLYQLNLTPDLFAPAAEAFL